MNSQNNQENEFQRLEQELHERERAIRLREIQAEINEPQPPLYQTQKHQPSENSVKQQNKQLLNVGKFFLQDLRNCHTRSPTQLGNRHGEKHCVASTQEFNRRG
jgi:hypothetical protein